MHDEGHGEAAYLAAGVHDWAVWHRARIQPDMAADFAELGMSPSEAWAWKPHWSAQPLKPPPAKMPFSGSSPGSPLNRHTRRRTAVMHHRPSWRCSASGARPDIRRGAHPHRGWAPLFGVPHLPSACGRTSARSPGPWRCRDGASSQRGQSDVPRQRYASSAATTTGARPKEPPRRDAKVPCSRTDGRSVITRIAGAGGG